jgi:hypothetical protein
VEARTWPITSQWTKRDQRTHGLGRGYMTTTIRLPDLLSSESNELASAMMLFRRAYALHHAHPLFPTPMFPAPSCPTYSISLIPDSDPDWTVRGIPFDRRGCVLFLLEFVSSSFGQSRTNLNLSTEWFENAPSSFPKECWTSQIVDNFAIWSGREGESSVAPIRPNWDGGHRQISHCGRRITRELA